ncbi:glycosyltransferase family 2 protein [Paraburkholderia caballeronis]|uniref:Glycosyl transferase family 2 n=1 Tax=Paraburkholderia caballeronis TaxID=416943 RepID=A0A1H7LS33_9BURK|nr:glycosyltransferase family A protein [Paraburkholderia caballeronis]PXW28559.1 glycosyl transferase family 2 [Paraburkholderia caballeronis]PXX03925.1 glycosyl transferase family 2 [Paraburkholderia caballeronis]RAK04669.1 glycosyl transferase family 2 [Paraburkholderia caballeronis]SED70330.1 Glycosyl transferase family 2 [Paraburkholderia caballeronis]SEL01197.1 Glycosyl transferase family 2 [Paraburkholderia caballeronis]
MIGIVIPAHNEADLLARCLRAACTATARHHAHSGEIARIVVVLDACSDGSDAICAAFDVDTIAVDARNVGIARARGTAHLLDRGARWLAFTDADSMVAPDWLSEQLALGADAVCGPVDIDDWSAHPPQTRDAFARAYVDADGHRHVHGANLGVSAAAYRLAGGFEPLECAEDVALVCALLAAGVRVAWSARPRVVTSARRIARVRGGFADTLARMG